MIVSQISIIKYQTLLDQYVFYVKFFVKNNSHLRFKTYKFYITESELISLFSDKNTVLNCITPPSNQELRQTYLLIYEYKKKLLSLVELVKNSKPNVMNVCSLNSESD